MQSECEKLSEQLRQNAVSLVSVVWHGINFNNINSRRRMKIYEEYENKIKSASMTGKISIFLNKLCEKMDSNISDADAPKVLEVIRGIEAQDLDLELLDILRSESAYIILLMREANNELKEKSKQTTGVPCP